MNSEPPFLRRLDVFLEVTKYYDRVHPESELLQLKQVTALHHCSDQKAWQVIFLKRQLQFAGQ